MKAEKIAVFRWEDACGQTNWNERDDKPKTLPALVSGLVIEDTEEIITVGQVRFDDGAWRETLTIPKRMLLGEVVFMDVPGELENEADDD